MLNFLLSILAPGEKLSALGSGSTQYTLGYEGLSLGWAFFIFIFLTVVVAWSYRRYAPALSRFSRIGLIVLRSLLIALFLVLLVRPILIITIEETVRRPLLVLLDNTLSMGLVDHREKPEDIARAAIAKGVLPPDSGLKQAVDGPQAESLKQISRQQLLETLAANPKLNFWSRIYKNADLSFYGFGRKLIPIGDLAPPNGTNLKLTTDESAAFFQTVHYDETATAIGDSLRDLLDTERGQPVAGILLITDGGNNCGSSPIEAAAMAKQDGVPLFIYAVGITTPQDIVVSELSGPQVSNVKEKVQYIAHIRAQSMVGRKATIQLKANGKIVDEQPVEFRADGDQEIPLSYTPTEIGEVDLEAFIPPLPEEAVKDNNTASAHLRVTDEKINVLFIDEEPRWDFEYMLQMLQRDRRMKVKAVLFKGDKDLASTPDSPFLNKLPEDKETFYANDLIILGDVDPADIGETRMKLLNDWVNKKGGSIIFMTGPKFNPNAFSGTPLEAIMPIETAGEVSARYKVPVQLKLTPAGEISPLLTLSQDPQENAAIWAQFAPVYWTGRVQKARPGAQILLTDPTPERANRDGPMPVIVLESYGAGQSLYVGFDETYRWRAHNGEKYYTRLWGQIFQALTAQHNAGSKLTQLKTDRPQYLVGDRVRISGHISKEDFEPLTDSDVPATVTVQPAPTQGKPASEPQTIPIHLQAIPDRPGEYRGEFTATTTGNYSLSTVRDPKTVLKFQVAESKLELSEIAMNEKLLRAMASASGGEFMREEDLNRLPDLVSSKSAPTVTYKKIPLSFTPYLLGLMILVACAEWLWRRKLELK